MSFRFALCSMLLAPCYFKTQSARAAISLICRPTRNIATEPLFDWVP
jgi:hypothetical protein